MTLTTGRDRPQGPQGTTQIIGLRAMDLGKVGTRLAVVARRTGPGRVQKATGPRHRKNGAGAVMSFWSGCKPVCSVVRQFGVNGDACGGGLAKEVKKLRDL